MGQGLSHRGRRHANVSLSSCLHSCPIARGSSISPARDACASCTGEWLADSETPVSTYAKLGRGPYSFLLESVVGGEKWAAYSFAGVKPRLVIRAKGEDIEILRPEGDGFVVAEKRRESSVGFVNHAVRELTPAVPPGLPRFFGGAVGWLGYDVVRRFEKLPSKPAATTSSK